MERLRDRWALVTGASSGLGMDFSRLIAEHGGHLVLVARRQDRLRELAREMESEHGVRTLVVPMDLSEPDAAERLQARVNEQGIDVDVLINNAGFGVYGPFLEVPWERERQMLEVDILALVHLTKLFVRDMVQRDRGYVLQVGSIGAYQPAPRYACYGAAKAFVLNFGEALSYELRHTNVRVTVLCPGVTRTEFLDVAGQKRPTLYQRLSMMQSRDVAAAGLRAMLRGKPSVVPGLVNSLPVFSLRFTPRRMATALANLLMQGGSSG